MQNKIKQVGSKITKLGLMIGMCLVVVTEAVDINAEGSEPRVSDSFLVDFDSNSEYSNVITPIVKNKDSKLNIHKNADKSSDIIGYLYGGSSAEVIRQYDDWTNVKSGDITGWVRTGSVCTGYSMDNYVEKKEEIFDKVAKVEAPLLRVRQFATIKSNILDVVERGDELKVVSDGGKWVQISKNNKLGFVSKNYVETEIKFGEATPIDNNEVTEESNKNKEIDWSQLPDNDDCSKLRRDMVKYAYSKLGCKYVYGGESFVTGIDCSAFVRAIYNKFGMYLPRTSREQSTISNNIDIKDIKPGDLLFYISSKTGLVGHVTMYIGDGKVIHASNETYGVRISDIDYRTPCKIINVVKACKER